jgi:hypothetical protein|tara:strand:+ start:388 stop:1065 length:678 start_codon:yes stop_codon:yes gene_type:complete
MEATNITSISQLPSSINSNDMLQKNIQQNIQQNQNNIVLTKNESINEPTSQLTNPNPNYIPQQETNNVIQNNPNYNELINQLQKASNQGITQLPSRDIPMNQTETANDVEVKPNFVPPPPPTQEDYIQNMQTPEQLINQNNNYIQNQNNLEQFYTTIQLPLIVSLLYFIFQLPYFRQFIKKMLPSLFGNDGNMNLYGFFFNSVLFGTIFFIINKFIDNLTMYVNN